MHVVLELEVHMIQVLVFSLDSNLKVVHSSLLPLFHFHLHFRFRFWGYQNIKKDCLLGKK